MSRQPAALVHPNPLLFLPDAKKYPNAARSQLANQLVHPFSSVSTGYPRAAIHHNHDARPLDPLAGCLCALRKSLCIAPHTSMPPQVADWQQVKATAIATGSMKQAAQAHGLDPASVRQRAKREQWPVGRRVIIAAQVATQAANTQMQRASHAAGTTVTRVTSASDAIESTLKEGANATKLGLTAYAARMAKQASESGRLEEAPLYKAVADIHGKMHPEVTADAGMHVSFFSITTEQAEQGPIIDVTPE